MPGMRFVDCLPLARQAGVARASVAWAQTCDTYTRMFAEFTGILRVSEIRTVHIVKWAAHLTESGDNRQTVKNKVSVIGAALRAANRMGMLDAVPQVPRIVGKARVRQRILSYAEEKSLVSWMQFYSENVAADTTVVLVDTGARLGSLWAITPEDINLRDRTLYFRKTKSGVPYTVGLTKRAASILDLWEGPPPYLSIRTYQRLFERARRDMGISDPDFIPHMLRHTCATRMAEHGVPQELRQKHLGHSDPKMTAQYTKHFDFTTAAQALGG